MAESSYPAEIEEHPFFKALAGLLDVGLKLYIVIEAHRERGHLGEPKACGECALLVRALDTRGGEERTRLFEAMRDFADRFGY